jgi:hypothetical protein|tara:strand:- start:592 stop:873 length:282 start_codon:yes stop_codon:yes gene_type:complete
MGLPKVKVACVAAVMQKAMHSGTMDQWTVDWLSEFCKSQPALATHMCAWIEHFDNGNQQAGGMLTSMTAMIGVMVKSIESQIECDELIEELGV